MMGCLRMPKVMNAMRGATAQAISAGRDCPSTLHSGQKRVNYLGNGDLAPATNQSGRRVRANPEAQSGSNLTRPPVASRAHDASTLSPTRTRVPAAASAWDAASIPLGAITSAHSSGGQHDARSSFRWLSRAPGLRGQRARHWVQWARPRPHPNAGPIRPRKCAR
jgi:hypothetical protein